MRVVAVTSRPENLPNLVRRAYMLARSLMHSPDSAPRLESNAVSPRPIVCFQTKMHKLDVGLQLTLDSFSSAACSRETMLFLLL